MNNIRLNTDHKKAITKAFGRAAATYDNNALLQKEVGHRLLERLSVFKTAPTCILDLGSGTGYFSEQLSNKFPEATCISLDISEKMLEMSRQRFDMNRISHCVSNVISKINHVCADAEALPLSDESVDFIFSSCSLQWCSNYPALFQDIHRVLTKTGVFLFSTFGPDTLYELRSCFEKIDDQNHVNYFQDMHLLGDALVQAKFHSPVVDREIITVAYAEVKDLLHDLKGMGANYVIERNSRSHDSNSKSSNSSGLHTSRQLKQLFSAYEEFRRDEILPATFEIIYGYALKSRDAIDVLEI